MDARALDRFAARYGETRFAPVVVVIPAYEEAGNIAGVIESIPAFSGNLEVTSLVVVDGGADGTADVAGRAGAYVCEAYVNRGQGAALRLGYRLAIERGASYVATIDADGQYHPDELCVLLGPLLSGEADFVQGSRRLGSSDVDDRFRLAGVFLFGTVISWLIGQRITDSSNGFRAMRTEVVKRARLTEDQYHASELLIGAAKAGFRVVERPVKMRPRASGTSKKAHNVLYGMHYARVIAKTWLRSRLGSERA